jgi:hypothetical protein
MEIYLHYILASKILCMVFCMTQMAGFAPSQAASSNQSNAQIYANTTNLPTKKSENAKRNAFKP